MDTLKRTNRTVERLAKTSADSYKMVLDHVVAQQERNVRFAQGVLDDAARELRHQADGNRSVVGELVERAEVQRDAYRTLAGEWVEAYTDLLYAPFAYYRQGLRLVEDRGRRRHVPHRRLRRDERQGDRRPPRRACRRRRSARSASTRSGTRTARPSSSSSTASSGPRLHKASAFQPPEGCGPGQYRTTQTRLINRKGRGIIPGPFACLPTSVT